MNKQVSFDEALNQTIEIFAKNNNSNKMDEMSREFLELIGNFYQSEKSYVFYIDQDRFFCKYRWTKDPSITVQSEATEKVPLEILLKWIQQRDNNNIVEANRQIESTQLTDLELGILDGFNLDNLTFCVIVDDKNKPIGGVGLSNRTSIEFDYRLLKSTTHFIKDRFNKFDMQNELKHIVDTDFLTNMYSRIKYIEHLEKIQKTPPKKLGIIFVNINGLRRTNEYLGFGDGDELIKNSANIINTTLKEKFYRISGDEFIGFFPNNEEEEFLAKTDLIQEKLKSYEKPLFSFGYAWDSGNNVDIAKLINEADVVMYINKQEFYHINNVKSEDVNDALLRDLLNYLANDEFMVYLQPQIELKTEKLIGAEALIRRFDKANHKMVFPDQFIPIYEQNSIIRHVDIFVLREICKFLSTLIKENKAIPISVNLSRVTLMERNIVETIVGICDEYNIPKNLIVIEITERIGIIENDVATTLIDQFKNNGFKVSLDDFGCAYSNIVTLANISVDEVKIDKSLVDNILTNETNAIIVQSVISMCNKIPNTHTLAEGIETREQADILNKFDCKYGQGYLYSRPIPLPEFKEKYT